MWVIRQFCEKLTFETDTPNWAMRAWSKNYLLWHLCEWHKYWDIVRHSRMLCWWQKTVLARRFDALRHLGQLIVFYIVFCQQRHSRAKHPRLMTQSVKTSCQNRLLSSAKHPRVSCSVSIITMRVISKRSFESHTNISNIGYLYCIQNLWTSQEQSQRKKNADA